jgi:hypothetical protein
MANLDGHRQMFYLGQIFYKFTINLTKLSILTLYLRIFIQTWFVRTCWCCFAVVSMYATASVLATVFQCTPINWFWDRFASPPPASDDPGAPTPSCINITVFWLCSAVYNISTDIVILTTLPFMIWSLRLPKSQKAGLTFVFGLGIFVFATSVLRMTTLSGGSQAKDPLIGTVKSTMWTMIEASTAVICACLPMCRTPLQRLWPRVFSASYASAEALQTHSQPPPPPPPHSASNSRCRSRSKPNLVATHTSTTVMGHANGSGIKMIRARDNSTAPREVSATGSHRGPGGATFDDADDDDDDHHHFEDLEMHSTSAASHSRDEADRQAILAGVAVVPGRMKGW